MHGDNEPVPYMSESVQELMATQLSCKFHFRGDLLLVLVYEHLLPWIPIFYAYILAELFSFLFNFQLSLFFHGLHNAEKSYALIMSI